MALVATALITATGCKKPEDDLGLDLLDPSDLLGIVRTDTLSIHSWPIRQDSIQTSALSFSLLGSYVDPEFGQVATGIVVQARLSANNVGPTNANWTCDSLVLSMMYGGSGPIYGAEDPQGIRVYRLSELLSTDSIYRNNRVPQYTAVDLVENGPMTYTPVLDDGPIIGADSLPAQLRIRLDRALGNEFLSHWGASQMSDNTNFLAFFNGLYIKADNPGQAIGQGGIWSFNLLNGNSKLTLYYHDSTVGTPLSFNFTIGSGSVRYTTSSFDHAGTPVASALADSTLGQQQIYVQALGGLRSEVRVPSLHLYRDTPYQAIAKAELIVPVGDHPEEYTPPSQLFAFRKSEEGADLLLPDQVSSEGQIGGLYNATDKEYRLNITRYVQGILNGTYENTGLGFVAGSSGISVNRAVLNGPDHADRPMRLEVTFTTY